jgi:hypothetical protein
MFVDFHEFIDAHNYVCYKSTLIDRVKEVFKMRLDKIVKAGKALDDKLS